LQRGGWREVAKDWLGWDWLCLSSHGSGVAVGSQVPNDRNATPNFPALRRPGDYCRAFPFLPPHQGIDRVASDPDNVEHLADAIKADRPVFVLTP
jgi:hypothetical protein